MTQYFRFFILALAFVIFAAGCRDSQPTSGISEKEIAAIQITSFPEQIDRNCRNGKAKIYDECSDQIDLFEAAQSKAQAEGKITLVSYGAEWCIWCHVFDAYIHGQLDKFTYTYGKPRNEKRYTHTMRERAAADMSQDAYDLKKYVSENFVVVHIDYEHAPAREDALVYTNAKSSFSGGVPFIFSVDANGKFAAAFDSDVAEIRRDTEDWYRGYDRSKLLGELKRLHQAALE